MGYVGTSRRTDTRTFGELLIDLEEDKAVVFGLLAETGRK
jgi:hypothetical protein